MANDEREPAAAPAATNGDIAIIGMAGRFPGAADVAAFWQNLVGGVESIRQLSEEELLRAGVPRRELERPEYVRVCPVLADVDKFDAAFFGMNPREASVMDPAHRLFLEVAWQALEDSGNTGLPSESTVGVFAASGAPLYWMNNVRSHREVMEQMGEFLVRHTGNDMNFLATRASYDLDLRGPSVNVQTACSSGLVAAHLARQSLLARECDMALVGGSTVVLPMGHGYHWKEGEILSPDGHCRPFDHKSAGTVFGSGAACIVLKRLDDALDNGDTIVAVIKGSAVNNDGAVKVGYLAPGVDGQAAVIRAALKSAGVPARSISYVEGHGTGTSVGDPIELTALEQAFRVETADTQFCGIGSVKSNIGHLGEAAGVASLIKVALALRHRVLPPTLGYEAPNPRFAMADSPFHVIAKTTPWQGKEPLRAGITALGAGGTNCHLVLEEPPPPLPGEGGRDRQLLVLSARTRPALDRMGKNLAAWLEQHADADLGDVAYTLAMGRRPLAQRRVVVAADRSEAMRLLRGDEPTRIANVTADQDGPGVVFSFPGGGAQYARMCIDLHQREPAFRDALEQCLAIVDKDCSPEVRGLLLAAPADAAAATARLQRPSLTLPALFAVEYSLAKLFTSWGLRPVALVGHSMGEYVAACLAGVFSLRDGLRLVALRGRLFERTQPGRMVGVSLPEAAVRALMPEGLSIAAVNAPELCVASGPSELIEALTTKLTAQEVDWTPIHIDVAAHSSLLEPILAEFGAFCRTIRFAAPTVPVASNLTGGWLTAELATDPEYWVRHLRGTVRFADCVETVLEGGSRVFLEIGPGRTLTTLVGVQKTKVAHAFNSVRHPKEPADDVEYALQALGKVWAAGAPCDWTALYDGQLRNRVPLPAYPFEGVSYWLEARELRGDDVDAEPHKRDDLDQWFATLAWQQTPLVPATPAPTAVAHWLLLAPDLAAGRALAAALTRHGVAPTAIVLAVPGDRLRLTNDGTLEVGRGAEQYRLLLERLQTENRTPEHVVVWPAPARAEAPDEAFFTTTLLAQAMANALDAAALTIVTANAFAVGGEPLDPLARLCVGPALVVPREQPDLRTRLVDLDATSGEPTARLDQLARELLAGDDTPLVALRAPRRFTSQLQPTRLPAAGAGMPWLTDGAVVLITGGLGGMGRVLTEHLAKQRRVKIALLSREALPPAARHAAAIADPATPARLRERLQWLQALGTAGADVRVVQGDVTDAAGLRRALAEVRTAFGRIDVVVHAAGVMDDAPLQSKTQEPMRRVLAPKVQGTLQLDEALGDEPQVFVVMSSIASQLGLPGQVDYTAANAFLDAFAEARQRRRPGRTLAIGWNAWRDVGMVVEGGARSAPPPPLPAGRSVHPWLPAWEPLPDGRRYHCDFDLATHWLLAEHRIAGAEALIPGTGFVELARAAFVESGQHLLRQPADTGVELRHVTFLRPFQVGAEARRLRIEVRVQGDASAVSMASGEHDELHLTAEARRCPAVAERLDLDALRARCPRQVGTRGGWLDQDFVQFGPRWRNLRTIRAGNGEAVIDLELAPPFASDLPGFAYHPALLDMATGAAQTLIPGFRQDQDFLVPFGYDRLRLYAPVTARCTSHVRLRPESTTAVAAFDVTVCDETGRVLIAIDGFTMKRVDAGAGITRSTAPKNDAALIARNQALAALLREAITPAEGVMAFERLLLQTEAAHVIASSVDVEVWRRKLAREAKRLQGGDADGEAQGFARPSLSNDFVAPAPGLESAVAAIWSKLLGVSEVGANDDFFELGGNSLIAVRFFTRVKKDFGIQMPLSTLFQSPTIRLLVVAMQAMGAAAASPTAPSAPTGEPASTAPATTTPTVAAPKSTDAAVPPPILIRPGDGQLPVFLVHDGLGEVLLYRSLALLLDPGHPVYGLEPERAHGRVLHTSITAMARAKVQRLRTVQPHGPYLLAGLCAGGVVATEIAHQLEAAGETVLFVGLLDAADVGAEEQRFRVAKERLDRVRGLFRPADGTSALRHWLSALPKLARKGKNWLAYAIGSRLERRRNARAVAAMRGNETAGAPGSAVDGAPEFLKIYELAHKEHRAEGVLQAPQVALFRATVGSGDPSDIPFREIYADALLGWQPRYAQPVQAIDVPGGHSSLLQEPHVGVLARELQAQLRDVLVKHALRTAAAMPMRRDAAKQPTAV